MIHCGSLFRDVSGRLCGRVNNVSNTNFGPLVAYLVPGATVLLGFSPFSSVLQNWFASTPVNAPTLGGFLFLTVSSLAVGMTVNAVRWAIVDTLHAWTGLSQPPLDFSRLGPNVAAYNLLIEIHYWHYQFHANELVATALAYVCYRIHVGLFAPWGWADVGIVVLEVIFYITSRDTLHLCGRPHNRNYVAKSVMWPRADFRGD